MLASGQRLEMAMAQGQGMVDGVGSGVSVAGAACPVHAASISNDIAAPITVRRRRGVSMGKV